MSAEPTYIADFGNGSSTKKGAKGSAKATEKPTQESAKMKSSAPQMDPAAGMTKFVEESRSRMKEAVEQFNGRFDAMKAAVRDTSDVLQESNSAALQGIREINESAIESIQSDMDRCFDVMRQCLSAKSVAEMFQIQSEFMRESMESSLARSRTMSELSMNAARSAFAPLQSGLTHVVENARKRTR